MRTLLIVTTFFIAAFAHAEMASDTINIDNNTISFTGTYSHTKTEISEGETSHWSISETFNLPIFDLGGHKRRQRDNDIEGHLCGFHVGFNRAIEPSDDNFDNSFVSSIELGFLCIGSHFGLTPNSCISVGCGLNWRNYKLTDDYMMRKQGGYLVVDSVPEGGSLSYSKLRIFSFYFPVVFEIQQLNDKGFHGFIGAQADLRLGRSLRNEYDDYNGTHKEHKKHIRTLPIGCDVIAQVGYRSIAFYGKYSLVSLFENNRGPIDKAFTIGIKWCWDD